MGEIFFVRLFEALKKEKLHPPLRSQGGDALHVGTWDEVEFPTEVCTVEGACVHELGGVITFLVIELCACSATYSSYGTRRSSFTLL